MFLCHFKISQNDQSIYSRVSLTAISHVITLWVFQGKIACHVPILIYEKHSKRMMRQLSPHLSHAIYTCHNARYISLSKMSKANMCLNATEPIRVRCVFIIHVMYCSHKRRRAVQLLVNNDLYWVRTRTLELDRHWHTGTMPQNTT